MRLLVLATYRPSDMALASHPFLEIRGDLRPVACSKISRLRFLDPADVSHYLALEFPENSFPQDFAADIYGKTEAIPCSCRPLSARFRPDRRGQRQMAAGRLVRGRPPCGPCAA
jgi:hypothetical protein